MVFIILFTTSGIASASFRDVPRENPNYEAINYLQDKHIVSGNPDGTYRPDDQINRAAFTKIVVGGAFYGQSADACDSTDFKDIPHGIWYERYVCLAQKNNVVEGYSDGTFGGEKLINLAEAAKIIVNAYGYKVQPDPQIWYKPYIEELSRHNALPITLTSFDHKLTRGEMAEIMYRLQRKIEFKSSLTYSNLKDNELPTGSEKTESMNRDKLLNYQYTVNDHHIEIFSVYIANIRSFDSSLAEGELDPFMLSSDSFVQNYEKVLKDRALDIGSYNQDDALINVMLEDLETLAKLFADDMPALVDFYIQQAKLNENSSLEEVGKAMNEIEVLTQKMTEEAYVSEQELLQAQLDFASKYSVQVIDVEAMTYLNDLFSLFNQGLKVYGEYSKVSSGLDFVNGDLSVLEAQRQTSMNQLKNIRAQVLEAGPYGQDNSLLNATLENLDMRYDLLAEEKVQILDLLKKFQNSPQSFTQSDLAQWKNLEESTLSRLHSTNAPFLQALWHFHNIYHI